MNAPSPKAGKFADWKRRAFSTPLDTFLTIGVGVLLFWLAWTALDWAVFRAVFNKEDVALCREANVGACWSVIDARHRLILFGLYPYDEHWRSTLAAVVIVGTVILSCVPWF